MKLNRPKFHNIAPGDFKKALELGFDIVELKYDGWWGQLLFDGNRWRLYSRTGQLKQQGVLLHPVNRTLLHGEYIFGTEWAKGHALYDNVLVYGAETIDGTDVRNIANREVRHYISVFLKQRLTEGQLIRRGVDLVPQWPIEKASVLWDQSPDFEGLVFKQSHGKWGAPYGRMKREVTIDYVCLGFEISESDRHSGWGVASILGGLRVNGHLQETCKVSGLTDEQRREFFDKPARFIGRVFEAEGKKITKRGALRHPNFKRWRDDKAQEECTWKPTP